MASFRKRGKHGNLQFQEQKKINHHSQKLALEPKLMRLKQLIKQRANLKTSHNLQETLPYMIF